MAGKKKGQCKPPPRTIKSNGRNYSKDSSYKTKSAAKSKAKSLRANGYNATVKTNGCNVSTVYKARKKKRK